MGDFCISESRAHLVLCF